MMTLLHLDTSNMAPGSPKLFRGASCASSSNGPMTPCQVDKWVVDEQPVGKRQRKQQCVFSASTFAEPGMPADYNGPFRDNVRAFLEEFGCVESFSIEGKPVWSLLLEDRAGDRFHLVVVQEDVAEEPSKAHCDYCRCVGWSHHPVSIRRYHFVVPSPLPSGSPRSDRDSGRQAAALRSPTKEGQSPRKSQGREGRRGVLRGREGRGGSEPRQARKLERSTSRKRGSPSSGKGGSSSPTTPLPPECHSCWPGGPLDSPAHFLHGIVHSNGFGHLVQLNPPDREGGETGEEPRWKQEEAEGEEGEEGEEDGRSRRGRGREPVHWQASEGQVMLMQLWDNLCQMLRVRKISVDDMEKKGRVDLRMLHSVTHGCSWFARWGYVFGHGTYGITGEAYEEAVSTLRNAECKLVTTHFQGVDSDVQLIIRKYQSRSAAPLKTLGDLVLYLTDLLSKLPRQHLHSPTRQQSSPRGIGRQNSCMSVVTSSACSPPSGPNSPQASLRRSCSGNSGLGGPIITEAMGMNFPAGRWSAKRLELAQDVIVAALREQQQQQQGDAADDSPYWVSRHVVRDAARQKIGDTGLLDFVLKSIGNRQVGAFVVRRSVNPETRVLDFCVERVASVSGEGGGVAAAQEGEASALMPRTPDAKPAVVKPVPAPAEERLLYSDVEADLLHLYRHCLVRYSPGEGSHAKFEGAVALNQAVQIIKDTKHFFKDYRGELTRAAADGRASDDDGLLRVLFSVVVEDVNAARQWPSPPAELALLAPHKSVRELRDEASRAFQDTYLVMANFQVDRILNLDANDGATLFGTLASGAHLVVEGSGIDRGSEWRYEGGVDSWVVDCPCGATDDDGERMICCDSCETWQHTRCVGIVDAAPVPENFFCPNCLDSPSLVPNVDATVEDVQQSYYYKERNDEGVAWETGVRHLALGGEYDLALGGVDAELLEAPLMDASLEDMEGIF